MYQTCFKALVVLLSLESGNGFLRSRVLIVPVELGSSDAEYELDCDIVRKSQTTSVSYTYTYGVVLGEL